MPLIERYCKSTKLINVRADRAELSELTFFANLRKKGEREALTRALAALPDVANVSLYYDTEQS